MTQLPVPSDERITALCKMLEGKMMQESHQRKYAPVKHVLTLVGVAGVIGLSLVAPTAVLLAKPFLDEKRRRESDSWKAYNPYYLKRTIERLKKQRLVKIEQQNDKTIIMLNTGGKRRILKYALEELSIQKPGHWDGHWRLVIYDVNERKRRLRDIFRDALRSLGFYNLQGSVWIYPYPCEEQIAFLREYFGVGSEVLYLVTTGFENDAPYRTYFEI